MKIKELISRNTKFILIAFLWGASAPLFAWGPKGHYIVAEIANQHLNATAKKQLEKIIGSESLPQVSVWPDEIKSDHNWKHASDWHFVSIPDNKKYQQTKLSRKGDIIRAIKRFKKEICNLETPKKKRYQAVKFLTHFIADIHQPLHVGRKKDRGGNSIRLKWFGKRKNLHQVWDRELIEMQGLSFSEYVRFINHPSKAELLQWQSDKLMNWVEESQNVREQLYQFDSKKRYWEYQYLYKNKKLLHSRLLKAGVRLAGVLNRCLK